MPLLETRDLTAFYGDFQALFGISLSLEEHETIAVIGANGAGKSTFLKTIAGLLPSQPQPSSSMERRSVGRAPSTMFGAALCWCRKAAAFSPR